MDRPSAIPTGHELELLRTALSDPSAEFRPDQLEAIRDIVHDRKRVLVVQRTGWGKSMVYFLATRILRDAGAGPTLLVSPLLALMRNQIEAAKRLGVRAETVNSSNTEEWTDIREKFVGDKLDVLLVSPERLANEQFVTESLLPVAERIGLVVVDEAHCISDWGHDFRPDYRRLVRILGLLPRNIPVLATTATANQRVVDDVLAQLGDPVEIRRGSLMRSSLALQAMRMPNQAARLAWLSETLPQLEGSGIIYALTVRDARRTADWLRSRGIEASAYYGALPHAERVDLEARLLSSSIKALVATSALGMGFDKPDLGFVVHVQAPQSIVHYYQQVGRAGRAIEHAHGVLLTGEEDADIVDYFTRSAFPPEAQLSELLAALEAAEDGLSRGELERQLNMRRSVLEQILKQLSVEDPAPIAFESKRWHRTIHPFKVDRERIRFLTERKQREWEELLRYVDTDECSMRFLSRALDDTEQSDCGKCAACRGTPPLSPQYSEAEGQRAAAFLRRTDLPINPRRQWQAGALARYGWRGRISTELLLEEGRALCRWGDMFWANLVKDGKQRGHFPDELVRESTELVRQRWSPTPFPQWVTCVPSLRTQALVPDFARRLAQSLGLPFRDCIVKTRETAPQKTMENSFHQSRNLDGAFEIAADRVLSGPVLLVDDLVDSKWTLTIVGALIRDRVGGAVYPYTLASYSGS